MANSSELNKKIINRNFDDIEDYINVVSSYFENRRYDEKNGFIKNVVDIPVYENAKLYPTWSENKKRKYGQYKYISTEDVTYGSSSTIFRQAFCNPDLFKSDIKKAFAKLSKEHNTHKKTKLLNEIYYIIFSYSKAKYESYGTILFFNAEMYMKIIAKKYIYKNLRKHEGRDDTYNKTFPYFIERFCQN